MPADRGAGSPATSLMNAPGTSHISAERVADIAIEVERLTGFVRGEAPQLSFNDEPGNFAALLGKCWTRVQEKDKRLLPRVTGRSGQAFALLLGLFGLWVFATSGATSVPWTRPDGLSQRTQPP